MSIDDLDDDGLGTIIEFDVDLNDVEKPEELPPGQYMATITKAEEKTGKASGSRYLAISIIIPPEQFPATYDAENAPMGFPMTFNRTSLEPSKRAMWRLKTMLTELGIPFSNKLDLAEFVNRRVMVEVVHEAYEGEDRAQIKNLRGA
jgi:hypothetical protein